MDAVKLTAEQRLLLQAVRKHDLPMLDRATLDTLGELARLGLIETTMAGDFEVSSLGTRALAAYRKARA